MEKIGNQVKQLMEQHKSSFIDTFFYLHQNPEISFEEVNTTQFIKDYLIKHGVRIIDHNLKSGVVGLLEGASQGPCIALRADIDALPIREVSSSPLPSKNPGVMHACGHDSHMASLLGAVTILSEMKDKIKGSVKFLFQPAEEINQGAKHMMQQKVLENPKVDAVFGLHNSTEIPTGSIAVINGPIMASVDRIIIKLTGKGGHGGIPQGNIDPIVCMASLIQSIQTIVSRNISPLDSAVVSICNVQAGEGTVNNVTPNEVIMYGTVRAYKKQTQKAIEQRLREIISHTAQAYQCTSDFEYIYELAVTDNNPALYPIAETAALSIGAKPLQPTPSTGGEDFSEFTLDGTPGFFYWLGVRNEDKDCIYPWHSPKFKVDEEAIAYGAGIYSMSVFSALNQPEAYLLRESKGGLNE